MGANLSTEPELEIDVQEAISRVDIAVKNRQLSKDQRAADLEKTICIETRSLLVVFKDFTLWSGRLDEELAKAVIHRIETSAKAMDTDVPCIESVSRRLSDLQLFIDQKRAGSHRDKVWCEVPMARKR